MTPEPHPSAWRVVWLVALPLLSAVSILWWRMGEQVEPFGSDQNFSLPLAEANATPFGVAGAVLRCVVIAQLVRTRIELGQLRFVVAAVWIGALLGIGLRGSTMTTAGANIGGGSVCRSSPLPRSSSPSGLFAVGHPWCSRRVRATRGKLIPIVAQWFCSDTPALRICFGSGRYRCRGSLRSRAGADVGSGSGSRVGGFALDGHPDRML